MVKLILFTMALQLSLAFVPIVPSSKVSSARLGVASRWSQHAQPLFMGRALFLGHQHRSRTKQVVRRLFHALRHLVVALISIFPLRALALIVDRSVVEAAESARMAVRPGTLKDRIISGHIELITTALLEKQQAQYLAMRNMIVGLFIVGSVFGVLATISTSRAEKRLRDQEMEIFGEFRDGSTEMIEEDEEDDPQIDAAKPADSLGGGPADNQPKPPPPNPPPPVKPPRKPQGD